MEGKVCFIVMGFGKKKDPDTNRTIDLDATYKKIIRPAVESAGCKCIRADEIVESGIIDRSMYALLYYADIVIADISTFNPNAIYELGVRHALRPYSTIIIKEDEGKIPFDIGHDRIISYRHLGNEISEAEAKKIIDEENETGYFKASTSSSGFRNGNMKMYNDIIFGLYSPKELVEWDQEINHGSDGSSEEHYLCLDSEVAKELYGDEKDSDWRFKYQLEEMYYGYYYRTLKYYKQTESTTVGITNNQTIPMIRMSEVYYIAAEAIFDTNPQEAQGYLELVKKGRGVSKKFDNVTNKSEFINLLVNDARREFLGEGQIFYMYKRLNRTMPASSYYSNPVLPTDENMILPKPDSESNI